MVSEVEDKVEIHQHLMIKLCDLAADNGWSKQEDIFEFFKRKIEGTKFSDPVITFGELTALSEKWEITDEKHLLSFSRDLVELIIKRLN